MQTNFIDLQDTLSLTKGWYERQCQDQRVLAAQFGGNEMRFRIEGTARLKLRIATEPYVFCHVFADEAHVAVIRPEQYPATIDIPVHPDGTEIRFLRTAVSSGIFYVDAMVIDANIEEGARFLPPSVPVPGKVFATFGDSISGNCCIGPEGPFDPYGLGYGYQICERFGWQYFNTARDGSGVSCTPFENPLAIDRLENDLIRHEPDFLLVFYGTNDVRNVVTRDQFRADFEVLMRRIVERLPRTRIAVSGLMWNGAASAEKIDSFNDAIREVAGLLDLPYCEPRHLLGLQHFDDDVHPSAEGQRMLAAFFGDFLAAHWPECQNLQEAGSQ